MKQAKIRMILLALAAMAAGMLPARGATEIVDGVEWHYIAGDSGAVIWNPNFYEPAIPSSTVGAVSVPDTLGGRPVVGIKDHAFYECPSLTGVTIPDSVTSIGKEVFYNCRNLTEVAIPDSVEEIGDGAFYWCDNLTSVTLPSGLASIGANMFYGCWSLEELTIPDSVTTVGSDAFSESGLSSLSVPGWWKGSSILDGTGLPDGCTVTYRSGGPLAVATATLEPGVVGDWYVATLEAGGGTAPYSWSVGAGTAVPGGLTLSSDGTMDGAPGVVGEFTFTVVVTDAAGATASKDLTLQVLESWGEKMTSTGVPHAWLEENAAEILAANDGDPEAAAKTPAANGRPVWECYVADLSVVDPVAAFKVKSISFADGLPVIEWDPDLNADGTKARSYTEEGKASMTDEWGPRDASSRFFRVKVELPVPK